MFSARQPGCHVNFFWQLWLFLKGELQAVT
jgi:hypothetical protein